MFSSLNSVLRNCLKQLRPAALFITLSNDTAQELASSKVGFGLEKNKKRRDQVIHLKALLQHAKGVCRKVVQSPFFTVIGCLFCPVFKCRSLYGFVFPSYSQTETNIRFNISSPLKCILRSSWKRNHVQMRSSFLEQRFSSQRMTSEEVIPCVQVTFHVTAEPFFISFLLLNVPFSST